MTAINETLQQYSDAIHHGFELIRGDVAWLFNALLILNIVVAALFWAFSEDQVLVPIIRKALYVGIFAWLIHNWPSLTKDFGDTFLQLGAKAGGSQVDATVLSDPGRIADQGLVTATPMMQAVRDLSGPRGFFVNFPEILLLSLSVLVVIVAFFFIAVQMAMALLTFKLGTLVAYILLPFSLMTHTTFIAERPLGWVVTAGVRFMLLTLVVGLGQSMFGRLQIDPDQVTVRMALDIALGAIVLLVLALTASRLATDLATGTPRLGALDAGVALSGTVLAGALVTRQTVTAMRQAAGAARFAAVKAAAAVRPHNQRKSTDQTAGDVPGKEKP